MEQIKRPERAEWWGIEAEQSDGRWKRLNVAGEKWLALATVDPERVLLQLGNELAEGVRVRVVWAPEDRRAKIGTSLPVRLPVEFDEPAELDELDPEPEDTEPEPEPEPEPEQPMLSKPRARPKQVRASAFPVPQGDDLGPLSMFMYIHDVVRKESQALQAQMMAMSQMMIEGERARSREAIESMRVHHASADQNAAELQRLLAAKSAETPSELAGLANTVQQLAEQMEELQTEDGAALVLSADPTESEKLIAGITNLVGVVASSPLGQAIGPAIAKGIAEKFAPAVVVPE